MSRGLDGRIGRLEEQQGAGVGREEEFARHRALQERIKERAKTHPEDVKALLDAEDEKLEAIEEARMRGEDPEAAPEVCEARRAVERAERRLLGEDDDEDDEGRRRH